MPDVNQQLENRSPVQASGASKGLCPAIMMNSITPKALQDLSALGVKSAVVLPMLSA